MHTVYLPPNSIVPSTYDKEPFKLEVRSMLGHKSYGMLASSKELGISDDHKGIVELENVKAGTLFMDEYELDDVIVDIENKMFTHRPDCFGEIGVAREISGIFNKPFRSPKWYTDFRIPKQNNNDYPIQVVNEVPELVPRFVAVSVSNIDSTKFPYTLSATASSLSGGTDGSAPALSDYSTGWSTFDSVGNSLVIYAPDAPYAATSTLCSQYHAAAVTYASGRTDCFAVIDTPSGLSTAAAQNSVTATAAGFAASSSGFNAAAYWPWYNIPDTNKVIGALRLQAPGAGMVGQYLSTDALRSPAKSPAGLLNKVALAVSTEHLFTNAELDAINTSNDPINPIRQVPGSGIVVMGARTLDNTPTNRYINIRRSLIYVEKQMSQLSSFALFENNDTRLWSKLQTVLGSFLFNYWNSGGLRGSSASQAYYVKCDGTTTSFSDIQAGIVNIEVGVALQYPAEFVVIKLGQLTGSASA